VSGDPKTQENAKGIWGHGRGPLAPKSYCCKVLLLEIEQEIRLVFFLGFGVSEGPGVLPDNIFFQVHTCIKNKTATFYFNFFFTKLLSIFFGVLVSAHRGGGRCGGFLKIGTNAPAK
jgi:hypothetical protein